MAFIAPLMRRSVRVPSHEPVASVGHRSRTDARSLATGAFFLRIATPWKRVANLLSAPVAGPAALEATRRKWYGVPACNPVTGTLTVCAPSAGPTVRLGVLLP